MRGTLPSLAVRGAAAAALLLAAAALAAAAPAPATERIPGVPPDFAAAQRRLLDRCSRDGLLDADALLGGEPGRADTKLLTFKDGERLADYSACRDLQGAAGGCSSLDGLAGAPGAAAVCRKRAANDRFIFAALRGGDAAGACRTMFALDGNAAPSVAGGCAAVAAALRAGNPFAACPAAVRGKLAATERDCRDALAFWGGDAKSCAGVRDAAARGECRRSAALAAGLRDPARCASAACRALEKDPKACEDLRAEFSRPLCARMAKAVAETNRIELRRQKEQERQETAVKTAAETGVRMEAAAARAKAAAEAKTKKPQFQKGQAMRAPADLNAVMKRLSEGLPPEPKKKARARGDGEAPPAGAR